MRDEAQVRMLLLTLNVPDLLQAVRNALTDGEEHGLFKNFDDGPWSCNALQSEYTALQGMKWGDAWEVGGVWAAWNGEHVDALGRVCGWWGRSDHTHFPQKLQALGEFAAWLEKELEHAA